MTLSIPHTTVTAPLDDAELFALFPDTRASLDLDGELLFAHLNAELFGVKDEPVCIGRYQVEELLGEGGMGRVYLATDPRVRGKVALKVLRFRGLSKDQERTAREALSREAHTMAKLREVDNIVAVYDIDEAGGQLAISMQYVDGVTLRQWQSSRRSRWREIVAIYRLIGRALAEAHRCKIIHGDLKPDNVLVDRGGKPRITDFGLARSLAALEGDEASSAVASDTIGYAGTPAYMAPEQFLGRRSDDLSDQFSFCVALYEALVGVHPYASASEEEFAETLRSREPTIPDELIRYRYVTGLVQSMHLGEIMWPEKWSGPRWLKRILKRGLSPLPEQRFSSMAELVAAIERSQRTRRYLNLSFAASLAVILSAGAGLALATYDHARSCTNAGQDQLDAVWSGELPSALDEEPAPRALRDHLVSYKDEWLGAQRTTCEQARDDKFEDRRGVRGACLELRLREFDGLVSSLQEQPASAVLKQLERTPLESPLRCLEFNGLHPIPVEAQRREQFDRAQDALARSFGAELSQSYREARVDTRDAVKAANASGHKPSIVAAKYRRGRVLLRSVLYDPASVEERQEFRRMGLRALMQAELAAVDVVGGVGIAARTFRARFLAKDGEGEAPDLADAAESTESLSNAEKYPIYEAAGIYYSSTSDYERAIDYYRRALKALELAVEDAASCAPGECQGPRETERARLYQNLADALRSAAAEGTSSKEPTKKEEATDEAATDEAATKEVATKEAATKEAATDLSKYEALAEEAGRYYREAAEIWTNTTGAASKDVYELLIARVDLLDTRRRLAAVRDYVSREVEGQRREHLKTIQELRLQVTQLLDQVDEAHGVRADSIVRRAAWTMQGDLDEGLKLADRGLSMTPKSQKNLRSAALEVAVSTRLYIDRREGGAAELRDQARGLVAELAKCPGYEDLSQALRGRLALIDGDPTTAYDLLDGLPEKLWPDARFYASIDLAEAAIEAIRAGNDAEMWGKRARRALEAAEPRLLRAAAELPDELGEEWGQKKISDLLADLRELDRSDGGHPARLPNQG